MNERRPKKLIIDTDPGIDDSMAILAAFNSAEVEVIALTTIFGNVRTPTATHNALVLCDLAKRNDVVVAEGALKALNGAAKERVADFVHGTDGFGNTDQPEPKGKAVSQSAAQYISETCAAFPGEVTILALGPLTNIAEAMQLDSSVATNMGELVVLGGAFFCNGNVNPAAEANIFGDPDAADYVFAQSGAAVRVVGLDVTHKCRFTRAELDALAGKGAFGAFLAETTQYYLKYHKESYGMDAVYVHDPTALAAVLDPSLFVWRGGQVRVVCEGFAKGHTIMDSGDKDWNGPNEWMGRPKIQVAIEVDAEKTVGMLLTRMAASNRV